MARKCVVSVALAITTLSACAGGNETTIVAPPTPPPSVGPLPPIIPPVTSLTAVIDQANAAITRTSFPNSVLSLRGTVRNTQGLVMSTGFTWTLDGVSVSSASAFEQTVTPGTYTVCLKAPATEACRVVSALAPRPVTGSVFLAVVTTLPAQNPQLVACAWNAGETGCVEMDANMRYSIVSADFLSDTSHIFIRCKTTGCGWKPTLTQRTRADSVRAINVVLLRDEWAIQCGRWAHRSIPLRLDVAHTLAGANISFLFRNFDLSHGYDYNFHTYQVSSFPIPIAIDRDSTKRAFLPNDSTIIMASAQSLSEDFGSQCFFGTPLFRAGSLADIAPANRNTRRFYDAGIGFQINDSRNWPNAGNSFGGSSSNGTYLVGGLVSMNISPQELPRPQFVIKHELVHTLGFGHARGNVSWHPGLMTDSTDISASDPLFGVLIAEEVAHMQAFYRVRQMALLHDACGMGCIHQGERIGNGLSLEWVRSGSLRAPTLFSGSILRSVVRDVHF